MYRVTSTGRVTDAKFQSPLAAICSALFLSMRDSRYPVCVDVNGAIVCIASSGVLFTNENGRELKLADAARAAERLSSVGR